MGLLDDIEHVRRAEDAQRLVADDGQEMAGYLVASMGKIQAERVIASLHDASCRLIYLGDACAIAARLMKEAIK